MIGCGFNFMDVDIFLQKLCVVLKCLRCIVVCYAVLMSSMSCLGL